MAVVLTTLEEHYGYLTDARKLERFRRALAQVVRPGDLVADVGCGFGILGLLCLQVGARHVWGIDRTDAIEIARETVSRAGVADRYSCIRDHSFRVQLPEPVDLIVCDHVGYFGVDYGIINTIGDARRRFLKPDGHVVPSRLQLVLAGVESTECRAKAEGWTRDGVPAEYGWLREYSVNSKHSYMFSSGDIATDPATVGTIDLTADNPEFLTWSASLAVPQSAVLDGLAGWFDCELVEGVAMTNSPLSDDKIDRPQIFLAFDAPITLGAGSRLQVSVSVRHEAGLFAWSVLDPQTGRWRKLSTWNSRILSQADVGRHVSKPLQLTPAGHARRIVCGYIDGSRTAREIEEAVLRDHPSLFPSTDEIRRFIGKELAQSAR